MTISKAERIHPGLCTRAEIQANPDLFYSDHVPQLLEEVGLKIMSYNVYGHPAPCGYDLPQNYNHRARYQRIAKGINLCAEKNNIDVILLQEVNSEQRNELVEKLGANWEVSEVSEHHLVYCYRKDKFTARFLYQTSGLNRNELTNTYDFMQIFTLKKNDKLEPICITNFHGDYTEQDKDKALKTILYDDSIRRHIVAGDFNIPMSEIEGQNGVTGIVPPIFNYSNIQGEEGPSIENSQYEIPISTDGGLYKLGTGLITKCKPHALDISTGKIIAEDKLSKISSQIYQKKENPVYRTEQEIRSNILKRIDKEIVRIKNHPFYMQADIDGGKISALEDLKGEIRRADAGSDYHKIIQDWEKSRPSASTTNKVTKNYRQIIHEARNRFHNPDKTKTEKFIDDLKMEFK